MLTEKDIAVLKKPLTKEGLVKIHRLLAELEDVDLSNNAGSQHVSVGEGSSVREYKQFHLLVGFCLIKGVVPNLALTRRADSVWHAHLADKTNYEQFCMDHHGVLITHIEVSRRDERSVKSWVYEAYGVMWTELGFGHPFLRPGVDSRGFPYGPGDEGKLYPRCHSGIA